MTAPVETAPAAKPRVSSSETFIARYGSAEAAVAVLLQDLDAATRTAKAATDQNDDLRKQLPGADKVVLEKKDADELAAFRTLKLAPDKLTDALTERDTLKGTVAAAERAVHARAAAAAAGLDPDGFIEHVGAKGLVLEMRDVQVTEKGKTATKKMPFVRPGADEKAVFVAAAEYVAKLPAHEQRALAATTTQPVSGPVAHEQKPTPTTGTTGDKVGDFIAKRNAAAAARPNPISRRQPAAATT